MFLEQEHDERANTLATRVVTTGGVMQVWGWFICGGGDARCNDVLGYLDRVPNNPPFRALDIRRLQRQGAVGRSASRQELTHNRQREREVAYLNTKPQSNILDRHPTSISESRVVFPPAC